jgi:hypothetical protein
MIDSAEFCPRLRHPLHDHRWHHLLERLLVICSLLVLGCSGGPSTSSSANDLIGTLSTTVEGQSHTLSGTVFGNAAALSGALVEALLDGTSTVAAASVTDAAGEFDLLLADQTYDLRVTPPEDSGFVLQLVSNLVLDGADRRHDVVLVSRAGVIGGTVRGYATAPVPQALVSAVDTQAGQNVATTLSDELGRYALDLGPAGYRLLVQSSGAPVSSTPNQGWYVQSRVIDFTNSLSFDVELPIARIDGVVRDASGAPVAGVSIAANVSGGGIDGSYHFAGASALTDDDGAYELFIFRGQTHFTLTPAPGSPGLVETVLVDADARHDFVLSAPVRIEGQVRGRAGAPIAAALVQAVENTGGTPLGSAISDELGRYALDVGPGLYRLIAQPSGFPPPEATPNQGWYFQTAVVAISGNTTVDFDLPIAHVEGVVSDPNGDPVGGVQVAVSASRGSSDGSFQASSAVASSGDDGHYELIVFDGEAQFILSPPPGFAGLAETSIIDGDARRDFVLPPPLRIEGQLRGRAGAPVAAAFVQPSETSTGLALGNAIADELGRYALDVAAGQYRLSAQPTTFPPPVGTPNEGWYFQTGVVEVGDDTTVDVDLPIARIEGIATDENGVPVPSVSIAASVSQSNADGSFYFASASAVTAADGRYELLIFPGITRFIATPPPGSGFATAILPNLTVTGDFSQTVALQHPDVLAPVIVAGPLVVHLSDTSVSIRWDTNEPADSVVNYGAGGLDETVSDPTPVTRHEVTLLDLEPASIHQFRVSSTDPSGNGPTWSATGSFVTAEPPGDVTAPSIVRGPAVISVGLDDALISWGTDEPATSIVRYGLTAALELSADNDRFSVEHLLQLGGLEPATVYFYAVESSDPDGNGPTRSATGTFETAAVPDTTPPQIIDGPAIVAQTATTLSVRWSTDEPSDSGVSYNDGTAFFVAYDDAFVVVHEMVLSDLTPDTTYSITVATTDRRGNGPTLGGAIPGTTLAAADTEPPRIADVMVSAITPSEARITWSTNERATSQVRFGVSADELTGLVGDAALVTDHGLLLTGLEAGRDYFFVVVSSDAGGRLAETEPARFTTLGGDPPGDHDECRDDDPGHEHHESHGARDRRTKGDRHDPHRRHERGHHAGAKN